MSFIFHFIYFPIVAVEMSCVAGGTTRDFPVTANRSQPNCVAPICPARLASGQKILFCLCSALSPCSHFVRGSFNTRFNSNSVDVRLVMKFTFISSLECSRHHWITQPNHTGNSTTRLQSLKHIISPPSSPYQKGIPHTRAADIANAHPSGKLAQDSAL